MDTMQELREESPVVLFSVNTPELKGSIFLDTFEKDSVPIKIYETKDGKIRDILYHDGDVFFSTAREKQKGEGSGIESLISSFNSNQVEAIRNYDAFLVSSSDVLYDIDMGSWPRKVAHETFTDKMVETGEIGYTMRPGCVDDYLLDDNLRLAGSGKNPRESTVKRFPANHHYFRRLCTQMIELEGLSHLDEQLELIMASVPRSYFEKGEKLPKLDEKERNSIYNEFNVNFRYPRH